MDILILIILWFIFLFTPIQLRPCSVIPNTHGLEGIRKIKKKFDLFGIQNHPIPLNPHGLRANRTSPNGF
jgi:hypothetical protein